MELGTLGVVTGRASVSLVPVLSLLCCWVSVARGQSAASDIERRFQEGISADSIGGYIETLTAHPTFPGSPQAKANAQWINDHFRQWGWDAHIEAFRVLFPKPTERVVELLGPKPFKAKLVEPPVPGDPYSQQTAEHLPSYFIYGPDGDVTAPLVYANYGLRDDYDALARAGISVKNAIVIVRAGRMWRGGKVELAAEHGAAAMLVFSDPKEDGYYRGPTYPEGSWRSAAGVQRGSVLYGKYAGDPLTPGVAATADAHRLAIDSPDNTIARIPAMPISYGDAQPLLAALGGPTAPESWRGALPITYRLGPSEAPVHLKIKCDWGFTEIYDVIATLRGSVWPDEWVIRGNHHDGWVYGAQDPHSAHSAMLEEARVLGELHKAGWHPKRTIIYASWDAEEEGTIGSTEWMEAHFDDLNTKAVAYFNTDVIGPGTIRVTGDPSLEAYVTEVAKRVIDPASGVSVLDRARIKAEAEFTGSVESGASFLEAFAEYDSARARLRFAPPGYGSDHHSFVSRAGIAAFNLEFGDDLALGAYHSIYDDFAWYKRFGDPGFLYGRTTAQMNGSVIIGLADAAALPMEFSATADAIVEEIAKLKGMYARLRGEAERQNKAISLDAYRVLAVPGHPLVALPATRVPAVDFAALDQAASKVRAAANHFAEAKARSGQLSDPAKVAELNRRLMAVERAFLRQGGLPGRSFYWNELYAPGRLWDTVPFPAIGDALLDGDWTAAARQIPLAAGTLLNIAAAIDAAAGALAGP
jgi:N-acetylated-alpha-linked acidic dipeptidase